MGVLLGSCARESCCGVLLWSLDRVLQGYFARESCLGVLLGSFVGESGDSGKSVESEEHQHIFSSLNFQ